MEPEPDNLILDFFIKLYFQACFLFRYWFLVLTRRFIKDNRQNDARSQRKTIFESLMGNFASEEIQLISPNEPVEDTFNRKIMEKDYDSAMKLAKKFDFDMDAIYMSMWENNDIDIRLIDECLTKISKTMWTLRECVHCIPPQLDTLKYLLKFGIDISSRDILCTFVEKPNQLQDVTEENLTNEGKKFVEYRQCLIHYLDRLRLYEEMLQRKHRSEYAEYFDSNFYSEFRKKSAFELAINFANSADCDSLVVLFQFERRKLSKHSLVILSNLSETISPAKYKELLEMIFLLSDENLSNSDQLSFDTIDDWSNEFTNSLASIEKDSEFEIKFYKNYSRYQSYVISYRLSKEMLIQWFRSRSLEILEYTTLVDNSLQLLEYGIEKDLDLKDLYTQLDLFSLLIYESEKNMSFEQFERSTLIEKMNLVVNKHDAIFAIENLFEKFVQKLSRFKSADQLKIDKKELFREFVVNLAETDFEECLKIFECCSMVDKTVEEIKSLKIINDACDLIELAIQCIRTYQDPNCLNLAFRVMECLPDRSQATLLMGDDPAKIRHFNRINDQADQIEYYLAMIEVFRDYNTLITVKDIETIVSNKSAANAELFFHKAVSNFCSTKFTNVDISIEWKNFLWNLQEFRKSSLGMITAERLLEMCVEDLLFSANKKFIQLALNHISMSSVKISTKKVPYSKGKQMLMKASSDYIKFANPIHDNNIELAQTCLQAFKDCDKLDQEIIEELDFLQALTMMYDEFELDVIPIKVKQYAQPRIALIEMLLKGSKKAYTKMSKVLLLSKLLRVCRDESDDHRDGVVLSIIGKQAIDNQDCKTVHEVCKLILERNLPQAWDLCYLFAKMANLNEAINSHQQLTFLSFALTYCPENDIDAHFSILNEIRSIKSSSGKQTSISNANSFIEFKGELNVNG